ncbi:MAG: FAD-dependent oxidoreductase [Chloroflexi bacterium]|nr:FAD-dependent oxidoreductase [Chloroflexota bacterium]
MSTKPNAWNLETDVLVVGTGGAGLTAAIIAHDEGAKVTVMEKTDKVGGTTAVSGGIPWIPNNHHMSEVGENDSKEEVFTFMKILAQGRAEDAVIEAFVDAAPKMLRYLEEHTSLKCDALQMPDYKAEITGGKKKGRSVGPHPFDTNLLGPWKKKLRRSAVAILPMAWAEYEKSNAINYAANLDYKLLMERSQKGIVGMGMGTIGHLLKACLDRGIEPVLETRAREFVMENGRVIGLKAEQGGKDFFVHARKGVILATGGFEWSEELKSGFLPGSYTYPLSPPACEGDGLKMCMAIGAALGNMTEVWGVPASFVPGELYDGRQLYRLSMPERCLPHTIMVNRSGSRFVDESHNYNDVAKVFRTVNPVPHDYTNVPAWCVFDQQYRGKYWVLSSLPGDPKTPEWLITADTLDELARRAGIDPGGIKETVERFNKFAVSGVDPDFGRGETAYDRYCGDPSHKPNPCLGTIEKPPFYALPVHLGCLGTKGGPRTNANGQVLHVFGHAIEGLYAVGNAMAGVSGPGYCGGGCTIGLGMTWGYIAAKHASRQA